MGPMRSAGAFVCALLLVLPHRAGAQTPRNGRLAPPEPIRLSAYTEAVARRQGAFKAADLTWSCKGTQCSTIAAAPAVMRACQGLVREIGPLRSFSAANRPLPPAELQQCNGDVPAAGAAIADKKTGRLLTADDYAPLARPLPGAPQRVTVTPRTPPPKDTPAPAAAPAPFAPVSIRTSPLMLTGTGATEVVFAFTPVSVRAAQLTLTGTGATEVTFSFTPVAVRTAPLTLTGTGRVE